MLSRSFVRGFYRRFTLNISTNACQVLNLNSIINQLNYGFYTPQYPYHRLVSWICLGAAKCSNSLLLISSLIFSCLPSFIIFLLSFVNFYEVMTLPKCGRLRIKLLFLIFFFLNTQPSTKMPSSVTFPESRWNLVFWCCEKIPLPLGRSKSMQTAIFLFSRKFKTAVFRIIEIDSCCGLCVRKMKCMLQCIFVTLNFMNIRQWKLSRHLYLYRKIHLDWVHAFSSVIHFVILTAQIPGRYLKIPIYLFEMICHFYYPLLIGTRKFATPCV